MKELPKTLPTFIWHFMQRQRVAWITMMMLPIAWAVEVNVFPYITKMIIDILVDHEGTKSDIFNELALPFYIGVSFWVLLIIAYRVNDILVMKTVPNLQANIRMTTTEYVSNHSHQYFSDHFAGSISNKISDLSSGSWDILSFMKEKIIPHTLSILVSLVMLWTVNPSFSYIFMAFVVVHTSLTLWLSKYCDTLSQIHSEARSFLNGKVVDTLTNIMNVRLFARNKHEIEYLGEYQDDEKTKHKNIFWYYFKMHMILETPSFLMMGGTFYMLIKGWQEGWISPGDVAFVVTLAFATMHAIWDMGMRLPHFFRDIGVCKQALSIIQPSHGVSDIPDAKQLIVNKGEISFEDVHFHYVAGKDIFKDKNITIKSGEKVGLVGFSGSGKSTFVNLILRFYDVESGDILIDGQNIAEITQNSLRNNIVLIL